jgi:UDPglucose 6-dehydrogenase
VVSNPEFLKEGSAVQDFMRPDRVVIGADEEQAIHLMRSLYAPYLRNHDRLIVMDVRSAELTKYAANAMLATRISFMNDLASVAERMGADIEAVRLGIGSDSRIGYSFLYAGCGYGGSCLPKDIATFSNTAREFGGELKILDAVAEVNSRQKRVLAGKVCHRFGTNLQGRRFAIWGLAFKPNTDDMREASSRQVIADLLDAGAMVNAYDPIAMNEAKRIYEHESRVSFAPSALEACASADALIIVTEWQEFRSPDFEAIKKNLSSPVIFDGRNLYDPGVVRTFGFEYYSIGRPQSEETE